MKRALIHGVMAILFAAGLGTTGAWADPNHGGSGYEHGKSGSGDHGGYGGHKMGMMHGSASHFIKHLLKHEKEIGLSEEQIQKLKTLQLDLDKVRIKTEADIQIAEREVRALVENEKSSLGDIEDKLEKSADSQTALRLASVKTRRAALAVLTEEQRMKEKTEHERAMQEHRKGAEGHGDPHMGGMKH